MATTAVQPQSQEGGGMGQIDDLSPDDIILDDSDDDEDFDDDYYFDEHDNVIIGGGSGGGGSSSQQQQQGNLKKSNISHSVANTVMKMKDLEIQKRTLHTSRDDRATSEQCLDPRTRLMLFKMLSNGLLDGIDGCLSTGKEANVYYAKAGKAQKKIENGDRTITELAIKIYKTSILVFKDRDKYVSGEHRWRRGYCKSNPRKMVKVWAEKEMRNYRRIHAAG